MSEEELRTLIETNFRLIGLSLREVASRTGQIGDELGRIQEELGHVKGLSRSNNSALVEMADRLDQTLEALKTLAFSDVESKARISELESQMQSVLVRLAKLDPAS